MSDKVHKAVNRGGVLGLIIAIMSIVGNVNGWFGSNAVQAKNVEDLLTSQKEQNAKISTLENVVSKIDSNLSAINTNIDWIKKVLK